MKKKGFNIPDKLYADVEQDCKLRNYENLTDYFLAALDHFLKCRKVDTTGAMKLIVLKYDAQCLKHKGETIKAGEWAYWGRGIGVICLDAFIERLGDKALLSKYLKVRELKRIKAVLEKECDRLATRIEETTLDERVQKTYNLALEIHKKIMSYFHEGIGTDTETEKLDELLIMARTLMEIMEILKAWLKKTQKRKRKETAII